MATQLERLLIHYPTAYVTDDELAVLFQKSDFQRYGRVKRALQQGNLVHVRRGLYCIGENLTNKKPQPFVLAQKIYGPSYVSMEAALAYYGLIPEAVYEHTCVTTRRSKVFQTPYGEFSYFKLPLENFFIQVTRKSEADSPYFIATPWKAICDYVYCHKKNWEGLQPLQQSLRIEIEDLPLITILELMELKNYYQSKRMTDFIMSIKRDLHL